MVMEPMLNFGEAGRAFGTSSRSWMYDAIKRGVMVRPVQFGPRALRFPASEIQQLVSARIAGLPDDQVRVLVNRLHAERKERAAVLLGAAA